MMFQTVLMHSAIDLYYCFIMNRLLLKKIFLWFHMLIINQIKIYLHNLNKLNDAYDSTNVYLQTFWIRYRCLIILIYLLTKLPWESNAKIGLIFAGLVANNSNKKIKKKEKRNQ